MGEVHLYIQCTLRENVQHRCGAGRGHLKWVERLSFAKWMNCTCFQMKLGCSPWADKASSTLKYTEEATCLRVWGLGFRVRV